MSNIFTVQEQLMENLERLMAHSQDDVMLTNLMQDGLNEIQSTVARFHEFEEANDRTVNEFKETLEKELVSVQIKTEKTHMKLNKRIIAINFSLSLMQNKMQQLQKQVQNRKMVYEKLQRDKQLEMEHGERIRKQFLQKQMELEYVLSSRVIFILFVYQRDSFIENSFFFFLFCTN